MQLPQGFATRRASPQQAGITGGQVEPAKVARILLYVAQPGVRNQPAPGSAIWDLTTATLQPVAFSSVASGEPCQTPAFVGSEHETFFLGSFLPRSSFCPQT